MSVLSTVPRVATIGLTVLRIIELSNSNMCPGDYFLQDSVDPMLKQGQFLT